MTIEERMANLESAHRRQRLVLVVLGIAMGSAGLMGVADVQEELVVKRLRVLEAMAIGQDAQARVQLAADETTAAIALLNSNDKPRAILIGGPEQTMLGLADTDGMYRVMHIVDSTNRTASIYINDTSETNRLQLSVGTEVSTMIIRDDTGKARIVNGTEGDAVIDLSDYPEGTFE